MSLDVFQMPTEQEVEKDGFQPVEEGIYLVALVKVERDPVGKKSGDVRDGLEVHLQVITGTVEGQEKREHREMFRWANYPSIDNGVFFAKRMAWLGIALDIIDRSLLGSSINPVELFPSLPWEDALGRVCYVKIKQSKDQKYREVDGLEIIHVNNPKAAAYPRDEEVIEQAGMKPWGSPTPAAATKAAPKPGAPKAGVKKPAAAPANGNGGSSGDKSATAATAAEGAKKDVYAQYGI